MNDFTASCHAEIVRNLNPDTVYVDACDVNADRFGNTVKRLSGIDSIKIISEHKADDKYKIVGAASIIAKVTRDRLISDLKNEFGNVGSGYPSDPVTIQFLEEYIDRTGKIPVCARKTWATTNDIFKKRFQHTLF